MKVRVVVRVMTRTAKAVRISMRVNPWDKEIWGCGGSMDLV